MAGILLLAPTGSGKSWACKQDPFFVEFAIDGDLLIDWKFDWEKTDWGVKDRLNLDIVLAHMQVGRKCVCWFVGTTAVADALDDGRLGRDDIGIVLLPEQLHYFQVQRRNHRRHTWESAIEHRNLCESLIRNYGLNHFNAFTDSIEYVKSRLAR